MITIKGQSLQEWKSWIENELQPPVHCGPETEYVLQAFLELIKKVEKRLDKE